MLSSLIGLALLGSPPPEVFRRLPLEVRERATVVLSGTYVVEHGPDEWLPDGRHRWPLLQGFMTRTVYRGRVRADYVGLEQAYPLRSWAGGLSLTEGHEYLLVLRPTMKSKKILRTRGRSWSFRDALSKEEVLAIIAL